MCIVCKLWNQGKLTQKEADRALAEMVNEETLEEGHFWEVLEKIGLDKEIQNG